MAQRFAVYTAVLYYEQRNTWSEGVGGVIMVLAKSILTTEVINEGFFYT